VFIKLSAQLNGMDQVEIAPTLHVNKPPHTTVYHDLNNRFSQLQIEVMSEGSSGSAATSGSGGSGISLKNNIANGIRNSNKSLIPRPGSRFWTVYGNKLRVFGTVERVCEIG
jgi:poly(A)-specific ribonuclease